MFRALLFLAFLSTTAFAEPIIVLTNDGVKYTGYIGLGDKEKISYATMKTGVQELPETFNWQDVDGVLPEVRNQGNCGSCWAFAIAGALESALVVQGKKDLLNLSEQQMVSCDRQSYGCSGGFMSSADYVVRKGLTDETSFPYVAYNSRCKSGLDIKAKAVKYFLLGTASQKPTKDEIKTALIQYGPLFVTVAAGGSGWSGSSGKVTSCRKRATTNHMVQIVGYDQDGWIFKNSWGKKWGDGGYSHIGYGCDKIAEEAGFVLVEGQDEVQTSSSNDETH